MTGAFSATTYFPQRAATEQGEEVSGAQAAPARKALVSAGGLDVFLAKYDPSGKLKWVIQAGGAGDDQGFDLAFDAARNIYVSGAFTESATFHGVNGTQKMVTGVGQVIFLAKYTPSGMLVWVQTGTSPYSFALTEGFGVAIEPGAGSVYLTGRGQGDLTFSSANGTTHSVAGVGAWHMYLAKYDTAGNFQWGQSNEAGPNSVGYRVAVDADDSAYVTGWMEGRVTFHSNDGRDLTVDGFSGPVQSGPDFPDDAFVARYDENGNVQWVNHIGGYKAIGTDIATSRDGRVSVTGFIGNIADSSQQAETIATSQPGGHNVSLGGGKLTRPYNKDAFVVTYDEDGELLDAQRFGGTKNEGGTGITYDRRGNLIVVGQFQTTMRIRSQTLIGKDALNLFVARFSHDERSCVAPEATDSEEQSALAPLRLDWAKEADGPGAAAFEIGPRAAVTSRGDVLVTGQYEPVAQFGGFKLQSAGGPDGFLALLKVPEKKLRQ